MRSICLKSAIAMDFIIAARCCHKSRQACNCSPTRLTLLPRSPDSSFELLSLQQLLSHWYAVKFLYAVLTLCWQCMGIVWVHYKCAQAREAL